MIFLLFNFITISTAFCPDKCSCDDDNLETTCIETNLEVRVFEFEYLIICDFPGDANDTEPKHENIDSQIQQLSLSGCKF